MKQAQTRSTSSTRSTRLTRLTACLLALCLLLCACGEPQYPSGAMTDDAQLSIICGDQQLVLDAVTLATLVTTELSYELSDAQGGSHQEVSVVFDLVKYLQGEQLAIDTAATWVLRDRAGQVTYVPVDEATDSLYIGITSGAQNLDYPVSVIPGGRLEWQVWQLEQVEFSPRAAATLQAEAEQARLEQQLEQAREELAGSRHIVLLAGTEGGLQLPLAESLPSRVSALPADLVQAVLADGSSNLLAAETVLAACPVEGVDGWQPLALIYEHQAVYLGGETDFASLLQLCSMIRAVDYACYDQRGHSLLLDEQQAQQARLVSNEQGLLTLISGEQRLDNVTSVVAGEPIIEDVG